MPSLAKPTVVQHRVSRAADASSPAIEMDVVVSSDRVPFVHHHYQVDGLGLAFLRSSDELKAAGLCSLEAFMDELDGSGAVEQVLVDVRSGLQPELVPHQAIARALARMGWTERALIVDWDWEQVAALRRVEPGVRVGAAMRGRVPGLDGILAAAPVDYLFINWDLVRAIDVSTCHARGVAVGTFEGWDTSFYRLAHDLDLDFVLSDDPARCRRQLADHAEPAS